MPTCVVFVIRCFITAMRNRKRRLEVIYFTFARINLYTCWNNKKIWLIHVSLIKSINVLIITILTATQKHNTHEYNKIYNIITVFTINFNLLCFKLSTHHLHSKSLLNHEFISNITCRILIIIVCVWLCSVYTTNKSNIRAWECLHILPEC